MILSQDIYPLNLLNDMKRATPLRDSRSVNKLIVLMKNIFSYSGAVLRNNLPCDMGAANL